MTQRERLLVNEVAGWPAEQQKMFQKMIADGNGVVLAHMLASRQAPGLATDDTFLNQEYSLKNRVKNRMQRASMLKRARAAGIHATEQSRYEPGLGKGPTDPKCWFTHGEGRGELQRRLDDRGGKIATVLPFGIKEPQQKDRAPRKTGGLAPDLVEEIRAHKIAEDPSLALKDQRELREAIVQQHGSSVKG